MAKVEDVISDMEYQSSTIKSEDLPVVNIPGDDFHEIKIKPTETAGVKKMYSKGPRRPQQKIYKELYIKLDEILFAALRQEFEVSPGHAIDRLDMVKFLTRVVEKHLCDCPDLDKLLNLRDTVLTGRIKKVFPEVVYKRKQIKQDHYRKAWLYVNIRRKPSRTPHHGEVKIISVSTTSTWTPPVAPVSTPLSQASSSPSSPASDDQLPSPRAYTNAPFEHSSPNTLVADSAETIQYHGESPQSGSGSDGAPSSMSPQFSIGCGSGERTGLVFDNSALQKWVISNYVQDNLSYVPVQDVVQAFKKDFNVDITYKDCHHMILSAFTSPRNRLIPKKNVRVSSIGQQYVYRGIAAINKSSEESQDAGKSECAQANYQSEDSQQETEESWKQRIREITDERDQALKERNQALAALMELEKEHAEALGTIERLKKENSSNKCVSSKSFTEAQSNGRAMNAKHREGSSFGNLLQKFGNAKSEFLSEGEQTPDRHQDQCDYSFWKEVVTQAKNERDNLLQRLDIVKSERNSYLERLHSLEKENQRLRDAVSVRHTDLSQHRLLDDISRHFQSNCQSESDAKEALSSVLAHLKSKRKQVTPSRLNKSPKLDHANGSDQNSLEDQRTHSGDCHSPAGAADSGIPSPENPDVSNGEVLSDKERLLLNCDIDKLSNNAEKYAGGEEPGSKQDLLVFTSGSEMIGFTRHPLDD